MIDKKIFYGEYTLFHWIELILQRNIVLPEYQRSLAWNKELVENFLKKLKDGTFVPPVIIGSLEHSTGNENIILDGQQRLTSILLGYLGIFPKEDEFRMSDDPLYSSDRDDDEEGETDDEILIKWAFRLLTDNPKNRSKADILANIDNSKYVQLDTSVLLDEPFLNENYLGFSYIVPINAPEPEQQKFYSTIFHDINQQGVALQSQESRRSLYYLNTDLVSFFEPKPLIDILKIKQNGKIYRFDYVRALALLAQFRKDRNEYRIAQGCKSQEHFELYYENYINAIVTDADNPKFGKFSTSIGIANIEQRTSRLKDAVEKLGYNTTFSGIIEADTKLFGLIYHIIFRNKCIDESMISILKIKLDSRVSTFKSESKHRSSVLTYIRKRIRQSIDIYDEYMQ